MECVAIASSALAVDDTVIGCNVIGYRPNPSNAFQQNRMCPSVCGDFARKECALIFCRILSNRNKIPNLIEIP